MIRYDLNRMEIMLLVAGMESLAIYAKRAPDEVKDFIVGMIMEESFEMPYAVLTQHIDALQAKLIGGCPDAPDETQPEVPVLPESPTVEPDVPGCAETPERSNLPQDMPPEQAQ